MMPVELTPNHNRRILEILGRVYSLPGVSIGGVARSLGVVRQPLHRMMATDPEK
jgi:hypothetical protein